MKATDDQALKDLDWKPAVGKYLVRAKYIALEWLDTGTDESPPKLENLIDGLKQIASETDVRHFPDYSPVHEGKLVAALEKFQDAKKQLIPGDSLVFIDTNENKTYEVDISRRWSPVASIAPESARETTSHGELILTVRKPDMIGDTMWQFKHGKINLDSPINDNEWLQKYHDREIDIRPGDALRCYVKFIYCYSADGDLEGQRTEIEKVYEVIRSPRQSKGFDFG